MATLTRHITLLCGIIGFAHITSAIVAPVLPKPVEGANIPEMVDADGMLRLDFAEEMLVLPGGLQPSLLCTKTGALVVQAQLPKKSFPSKRMVYPSAMETRISRDNGKTWNVFAFKPGENGMNMEGGAIQLHNGTIIGLDTYITPAPEPNRGFGQLYISTNDWLTLEGPHDVPFEMPNADFYCSKDDAWSSAQRAAAASSNNRTSQR